jgi:hypothetical protein
MDDMQAKIDECVRILLSGWSVDDLRENPQMGKKMEAACRKCLELGLPLSEVPRMLKSLPLDGNDGGDRLG